MNHEAIYKLNPSVVTINGDVAYDADGNEVAYDKVAVQAYVDAHAYILVFVILGVDFHISFRVTSVCPT